MAKIKFTAFMADARGKLAGTVFSKNKGGAYVRTKVTPSNPRTIAQVAVRAIFSALSAGWRNLTETQRNAWRQITRDYMRTDQFGDQKELTGAQLYNSLNMNLTNAGASQISSPLPPQGAKLQTITNAGIDVAEGHTATTVAFSPGLDPSEVLVVEATPPVSPGKANVENLYRKIGHSDPGDTSPLVFERNYEDVFGVPFADAVVYLRAKVVNTNTGEASSYYATRFQVTESE